MRQLLLTVAAAILLAAGCKNGDDNLPRNFSSGIETESFDKLFDDVTLAGPTNELHALMVIKDGEVIYEKYDPGHRADIKHPLWSGSKTFTATAIGFAVQEGLLSVQDPVMKFFSDDELPQEPSDYLKELTVWHLMVMSSGLEHDYLGNGRTNAQGKASVAMLNDNFVFRPGTVFKYNSMNTYLLSAIITKVTGKKLVDYLAEKLFQPLGIKDYHWDESAEGYNMGGWGLFLRTEDFAKLGQFFLNGGEWDGKQLLAPEWIDETMSVQISTLLGQDPAQHTDADWAAGYGYQIWKCGNGTYRLDGAWGQFVIICKEKNAVITINSVSSNAQAVLKYVWKDVYDKI